MNNNDNAVKISMEICKVDNHHDQIAVKSLWPTLTITDSE